MGVALERFFFFMFILCMLSHIFGCLWIFIGRTMIEGGSISWISEGKFEDQPVVHLYATSFYFTMTTITTVGYGDISGTCTVERIVCVFLHLIGVLSYSFLSGALTSIIFNYDLIGKKNKE
jgi:hypothetical protein